MRRHFVFHGGSALLLCSLLASCSGMHKGTRHKPAPIVGPVQEGRQHPYDVRGKHFTPMSERKAEYYVKEGVASYFASARDQRRAGSIYYAAHPTLPIPSRIRITSLRNGRSVDAVVVDRGPFTRGRIVDVSPAIAKKLDFYSRGLDRVRVEILSVGKPSR